MTDEEHHACVDQDHRDLGSSAPGSHVPLGSAACRLRQPPRPTCRSVSSDWPAGSALVCGAALRYSVLLPAQVDAL